ncbi:MAG TPA: LPD29 domain-containing protein [Microbacteriaceae bacterium]|jgi:hypothetical protein|nr:LPD29 domain-containing protein [Microbacteriaceae bacterium]
MDAIETTRYLGAAETAKLMRAALKAAFPGAKISVRLSRGNATYVSWTDGPTVREVQAITHQFESQTFNSSEDMREYTNAGQLLSNPDGSVVVVKYSSGLIIETRGYSRAVWAEAMDRASQIRDVRTGQPISQMDAETFAWREHVEPTL